MHRILIKTQFSRKTIFKAQKFTWREFSAFTSDDYTQIMLALERKGKPYRKGAEVFMK